MALVLAVCLALFASRHALASAIPTPTDPRCANLTLPVTVTATNAIYDQVHINSQRDVAEAVLDLVAPSQRNVTKRLLRNITISDTYNIAAKLCIPANGAKKNQLQIATHGGGFDSRYWDIAIDPAQYSYVENVLAAGYSILTYDRIGTGQSDKPDAYTVVQTPLEVEILREITLMAKKGTLTKYSNSAEQPAAPTFDKIIHVAHSIGSFVTLGLLTHYGELSDAAVITGNINGPRAVPASPTWFDFAYAHDRLPQFGSGYVIPGTSNALQMTFFSLLRNHTLDIGGFKEELLNYAYNISQPMTAGDLLSTGALGIGVSPGFAGPIQFMLGEFDFLFCGGDCRGVPDIPLLEEMFPNATNISVDLRPGTGHGLTFHRDANVGYKVTFDWLAQNGF